MLSGIIIQSTFYALLKVCLGLGLPAGSLGTFLVLAALLNMTLGNWLALVQTHTKRMLAYSTIGQMGSLMLAVGIGLRNDLASAVQAGFFLILAQAAAKGLTFLCKGVCHFYLAVTTVDQLRGTAHRTPLTATIFAVALASLAGVPPLAGFGAKWLILQSAIRTADALAYAGLVAFLVNSLVALGYYLPLVARLFAAERPEGPRALGESGNVTPERLRVSLWMVLPLVTLGALVVAIGLYPGPWLNWVSDAGVYVSTLGW
jgi:formate hydrogenlyase subunit 3/multisubunit Na+/H+ antiporter MnhD subunit